MQVATARDALEGAIAALEAVGCDTPALDAELLMAAALGIERAELVADMRRDVPAPAARLFGEQVRRRLAREPVAYIIGRQGFRYIDLAVDSRVLIPRPDTELLVEVALDLPRRARVHEVGTGSGAVALALLDERPDLRVSASDASPAAVAVARENAARLRLALEVEVLSGIPGGRSFDLVLANLPYVSDGELTGLEPEITLYEPRDALAGGADGLNQIRALVGQASSGTLLALEHSPQQAAAVRDLLEAAETHRDLAGRERVAVGAAR
jgi:release factor glutamine methyltransferase